MNKYRKLLFKALVALGVTIILTGICLPIGIREYINWKYSPEIYVEKVSLLGSFDCIQLEGIHIQKENINGIIYRGEVCYQRSINFFGGEINYSIYDRPDTNSSGYVVQWKNVDLILKFYGIGRNVFSVLENTNFSNNTICVERGYISNNEGSSKFVEGCLWIKGREVQVNKGEIEGEIFGYREGSYEGIYANEERVEGEFIKTEEVEGFGISGNIIGDEGELIIDTFSIKHPIIWVDKVRINDIVIRGIKVSNIWESRLEVIIEGTLVRVDLGNGIIEGVDECNNWLRAVPEELKSYPISEIELVGTFGFTIQRDPIKVHIRNGCRVKGVPKFINNLSREFKYRAYHPDGGIYERSSGPGSAEWVNLGNISPKMITALTLTEDPGFYSHNGIIPKAIENSLRDNIKAGRVYRGGSTITMQLAKNLWLSRARNISRKVQEGILTIALESCLSKDQIIELYLNVVEFGPDTYGIWRASIDLLGKIPPDLTLEESLYLVLRLPAPNKKTTIESRKALIDRLIEMGLESGKISPDDLEIEIEEEFLDE